jgi:peptide chain release factor
MSEIMLHITAGQGPAECEWVVGKLAVAFCKEALKAGVSCEPLEPLEGSCPSVVLRVDGDSADAFVAARTGTVRWIGTSTHRPTHRRRNWFVGVSVVSGEADTPELADKDITYQTMRASGPGGQHVNKTESAVRATHVPTGLTAVSQEQRSQQANRKVARLKLALLLHERKAQQVADGKTARWAEHHALERGNAVRTYEGAAFRLKS